MPISATGSNRAGPRGEAGFTLVELMIVLVIIGLTSAAALIAMPDPRGRLDDEAQALAARLVTARDLSIVGGHDIAVRIDAGGYGFARRSAAGWVAETAPALKPRLWGSGIAATSSIEGGEAIVFDTTGLASPALVALERDRARAVIRVDAAGSVHVDTH